MALPGSGAISMSQVNTELGRSATQAISLNDSAVRTLAGKGSGAISLGDLRGKANLTFTYPPGSYSMQEYGQAAMTITSNRQVTWTYGGTLANVSVANGGTSASIMITTNVRRNGTQQTTIQSQTNLTGTVDGKAYTWSINQIALASGSGGIE
ncbi:hypothetical protein [Novosphingobium sp. TCA1]|uniref:hypothetical protein n=1 Tax=Novosphingobium sp. TCA1 TaxID=2682474 RepID=UPI0013098C4F|nr:hypothetical protein [Novosphingobium sp. TCA1]GFE77730.1 hypothetical protein NTCA1_53790 [Novosphingobium sp. TCA1]